MPQSARSQQNSQPLSTEEKRAVLLQLYELGTCRQTVLSYEDFIKRDREQDESERALSSRALELERQATALMAKERDLAAERATFYEQAFKSVTKGRSAGCWIAKVFTLGIARCR